MFHSIQSDAQGIKAASQDRYKQFASSVTYVVSYDNPFSDFNSYIKKAMEKNWTMTPFEMISWEDFETKKSDSKASFIFISEAMAGNNKNLVFNILNFVMGDKSSGLDKMPDLGSVPLSYVSEDEDFEEDKYLYKLDVFLRFMQYYAKTNIDKPNTDVTALVASNQSMIQSKEIWMLADELNEDVNTVGKIAGYYTGKVRIVTVEEITNAIADKNQDVLILHIVSPVESNSGKCMKFIISVAEGAPYYYSITDVSAKKPGLFLSEDFKKL